jgi:hypothetical protein
MWVRIFERELGLLVEGKAGIWSQPRWLTHEVDIPVVLILNSPSEDFLPFQYMTKIDIKYSIIVLLHIMDLFHVIPPCLRRCGIVIGSRCRRKINFLSESEISSILPIPSASPNRLTLGGN